MGEADYQQHSRLPSSLPHIVALHLRKPSGMFWEKSAGGEGAGGLFFHASLLIANERLTPYQVYSFEPGSDKESKSHIKGGVNV